MLRKFHTLPAFTIGIALTLPAAGLQITGYQPTAHDRFQSGFASAPVRNTGANFIGRDFDWTSVGWNSQQPRQGHGYLSPRHHLNAKHVPDSNNSRRIFGKDNVIRTLNLQARIDLGYGVNIQNSGADITISRLAGTFPASSQMPRYPVLDLNASSTSNSPSNYNNRDVFLYGHWGWDSPTGSTRIGQTPIHSTQTNGTSHLFLTFRSDVQLEGQDSGSPAFAIWANPDGGQELALIGNHAAIDETNGYNIHNFIGSHEVMAGINGVMTPDGFALRVVGEPAVTWVGTQSTAIADRSSWGLNRRNNAPSDAFVTFNGSSAGNNRLVSVDSDHNLRGLYFRNTGGSALGFQFNGTSELTIGRGGVLNLDDSRQVFEVPVALGDSQFWDAGAGGVSLRNVATNVRLLNIRSAGPSIIAGNVSGSGGLALEGGQLHIQATSSYTGKTWVHDGTLRIDGDLRTSEALIIGSTATLRGHGKLPDVQGRGGIAPDGILTAASIKPANGMSIQFRFAAGAPIYASPETSPNDVLRLTGNTPVAPALGAQQTVAIYLDNALPDAAVQLQGGLFFDNAAASSSSIEAATWQVYVADPNGSVTYRENTYSPTDRTWSLSLEPASAAFPDGPVDGSVMQLNLSAAPGTYAAWADSVFPESLDPARRAPDATPFDDGIPNMLAYALGLDPLAAKSGNMPHGEVLGSEFRFRYRSNIEALDLEVIVETSENLTNWNDVVMEPAVVDPDVDLDGRVRMLEVSMPIGPLDIRRFARLRVRFTDN